MQPPRKRQKRSGGGRFASSKPQAPTAVEQRVAKAKRLLQGLCWREPSEMKGRGSGGEGDQGVIIA